MRIDPHKYLTPISGITSGKQKGIAVMNKAMKFIVMGASVFAIGIVLSAQTADAAGPATCTVSSIIVQPNNGLTGGSNIPDVLLLSCSGGGAYQIYVGTPTATNNCYADVNAVQSMQALGLTARITGNSLTIYYNTVSCPGNSGANIITFMSM